jgi:hypothetical protein
VGYFLEGQPEHLLPRVSNDLAQLLVDPQPPAVRSGVPDSHRGLLEGGLEPLLAFAQLFLRDGARPPDPHLL